MIVVVDTNALHSDIYVEGASAQTLLGAAGDRDDLEVWVPSVVIEEMVRQFPDRLSAVVSAIKRARHDVHAFGMSLPSLPDEDKARVSTAFGECARSRRSRNRGSAK